MGKLKEIAQGWINSVRDSLGVLSPEIKELSEKRLEICSTCPLNVHGYCDPFQSLPAVQDFTYTTNYGVEERKEGELYSGCSCPLGPKSKSPISCCPVGKFLDVKQEEDGNRTKD